MATPGVGVESEEIDARWVRCVTRGSALKVVPCIEKDFTDISGAVANGNRTSGMLRNVVFEVARYGLARSEQENAREIGHEPSYMAEQFRLLGDR